MQGVSPEDVVFQRFVPHADYLKLYHHIDICLDTFPYNGQTTTLDAAWMGVPTVTIMGQTSAARAGFSLAQSLGMLEMVANSQEQFVAIAANLANDLACLQAIRASLRQRLQKSPLMDATSFAAGIEAAYRGMWQRWCTSKRDSFST
jgi:predicted O-linked N-acetylglucosamine transferase (SPINDLY family)